VKRESLCGSPLVCPWSVGLEFCTVFVFSEVVLVLSEDRDSEIEINGVVFRLDLAMSSLSRELVFLILQFLEEEKFKESVHK